MTDVEGGLAEPTELEPEQGSLDLAGPDDAPLARRLGARSRGRAAQGAAHVATTTPTSLVWEKLTRTTLDGIAVDAAGHPCLVEDLATAGRPERLDDWDIRAHLSGPDAKTGNEALLVDLQNGATSLWLEVGGAFAPADLDASARRRAPRPRAGRPRRSC